MKADPAIYQTLENSKRAGGVDSSTAVLHMLLGEQGYLGICPADGGYIDFAAALDPAAIRSLGGIAPCIQSILSENAISMDGLLESAVWQATPLLTRTSTPLARSRVFLLGDSAGYVEPFTGEGMSWALAGARSLASILEKAVGAHRGAMASQPGIVSPEDEWKHWVVHQRGTRQTLANWVARQSRSVWKAKWVLKALDWAPPIRNFLVQKAMR
jgi:2-polyprenyl-6-methoxyphenol hydroxylase-like FAD-dependent oxidoreductase